jgi:hypothetical protein
MTKKDQELIERYLRNELTEAERTAFEQKLDAGSAFRQEVKMHEQALQAIRLKGREALKDRLRERDKALDGQQKNGSNRNWRWVFLFFAVAALVVVWQWNSSGEKLPEQPQPSGIPSDSLENDTLHSPPQKESNQKQPAVAQKPDADQLFATYFQPYKDESLNPAVRSEDDMDAFDRFILLYLGGKHAEALAAFEKLSPALQRNGNTLFIKANSLLATGKAEEAAAILEQVTANGRTRYPGEARWYLALAYLKKGDRENATAQLKKVAGDAKNARQGAAKKMLTEMQ